MGADRDIAHRTGKDQIRCAIEVSTIRGSVWSHAITYINNGKGTFRRYDNDDQARLEGTYTTVTWGEITQTWGKNTSLFAIVPIDSELANARNVTVANEREQIRRRREELRKEGMERLQILHIIREEEKRAREDKAYQTATNRTTTNNPTQPSDQTNTSTIASTIRSGRDSPPNARNNGLTHDPNDASSADTLRSPSHVNEMTTTTAQTNNPTLLRTQTNTSMIATTIRSRRDSPPITRNDGLTHDPNDASTQRRTIQDNEMTTTTAHANNNADTETMEEEVEPGNQGNRPHNLTERGNNHGNNRRNANAPPNQTAVRNGFSQTTGRMPTRSSHNLNKRTHEVTQQTTPSTQEPIGIPATRTISPSLARRTRVTRSTRGSE